MTQLTDTPSPQHAKSSPGPVLTVSQLTQAIKMSLETTFPNICLQGEVSNFKLQTSGHLYFSVKDAQSQIAAVMFRTEAQSLQAMPKAGDQVIIKGELNVYPSKGNYQLIVRELSYVGLGELLQKLEALKIKLYQMGWFKATRKKPIPKFPKIIGVVTSPTGAVIQDILNILTRRFSGFHLILNPVKVQGEGAAQEIAEAIRQFNHYNLVDVMIVGRGGGSIEDLWAFNEESVAEAIFNSRIPIICAVGHETDHCIAEYVADVRAPTPSAAAEIVISEKTQLLLHLETLRRRLQQTIMHLTQKDKERLERILKHPLILHPLTGIALRIQKLDDIRSDIHEEMIRRLHSQRLLLESKSRHLLSLKPVTRIHHFRNQIHYRHQSLHQGFTRHIQQYRQRIQNYRQQLDRAWSHRHKQYRQLFDSEKINKDLNQLVCKRIEAHKQQLKGLTTVLEAIDPKGLLSKGYSILFSEKDHFVINSVHQLDQQERIRILLADGEILVTINEVRPRGQ